MAIIEWHSLVEDRIRVAELDTSFTSACLASAVILSLWHMQQLSHTYAIMLQYHNFCGLLECCGEVIINYFYFQPF